MWPRLRWVLSGALALALVAALLWRVTESRVSRHDLTSVQDIQAAAAAITMVVPVAMRSAHVPGVAVAIAQDGHVTWTHTFGIPPDAIMEAGSISKTVAAAAVLGLADQGVLDLDTPVSAYLTSWHLPGDFPDPDQVTLRHLLSHTAGIDTPGYLGLPADQRLPSTTQSLAGASTGHRIRQTGPTGKYSYSGGGFTIAQKVVEDVTGQPFPTVARREVLVPLGMDASGYACTEAADAGPWDAVGHLATGNPAPRYRYSESAAAGLCTTAGDLATFADWLASSDPRAQQLRRPERATGGKYGLGVEVFNDETVGHLGVNRGYHAEMLANPAAHLALVVLTNGDRGGDVIDAVLKAWHGGPRTDT